MNIVGFQSLKLVQQDLKVAWVAVNLYNLSVILMLEGLAKIP